MGLIVQDLCGKLAQARKLRLGMFVVRLVRVFRGLLFRAIYGVGSGWDGVVSTGGLADGLSPAVFSVICVFLFFVCFFFPLYFATLFVIGASLFTLTITELDEGQS